ncbi:MAG: hypothetical protein M1823_006861, partial [Watsoniomyces obsoletus]
MTGKKKVAIFPGLMTNLNLVPSSTSSPATASRSTRKVAKPASTPSRRAGPVQSSSSNTPSSSKRDLSPSTIASDESSGSAADIDTEDEAVEEVVKKVVPKARKGDKRGRIPKKSQSTPTKKIVKKQKKEKKVPVARKWHAAF